MVVNRKYMCIQIDTRGSWTYIDVYIQLDRQSKC